MELCLQLSLHGGVRDNSICVGKQKHEDIVHDLFHAIFISFTCLTTSSAPTFSGKFSGERAYKLRTSYSFTKSRTSEGAYKILSQKTYHQQRRFPWSLITCLIKSQHFTFYYSFAGSFMQPLDEQG